MKFLLDRVLGGLKYFDTNDQQFFTLLTKDSLSRISLIILVLFFSYEHLHFWHAYLKCYKGLEDFNQNFCLGERILNIFE